MQLNMFPAVVVFTGPAKLESGKIIVREALQRATEAAGMRMAKLYSPTCSYVIASRDDTVKAMKAKSDGKMVLTYDQYVKHLADLGVDVWEQKFHEGAVPNKIVDEMPVKLEWSPTDATGAIVL